MAASMSLLDNFMPHGVCYQWRPDILWLNVASDMAIGFAYFSIPIALFYFLRNREDVPFRGVVRMFSVFILACGVTHFMSVFNVWNGYYGIQGVLKAITALASIATALMLYPVMPKLLALKSPRELEHSNRALQQEIEHRQYSEMQTSRLQHELAHMGRLTAMGQMATGLAHELNQPLLAISQSADTATLAANESHEDPELVECLEDIQKQTQRAGGIIGALRQFASKDIVNRSVIDLHALIGQTIQLVKSDSRAGDVNIQSIVGDIAKPTVDRVQIAQVLLNLLRNGIDAITYGNSSDRCIFITTCQKGDLITVKVEDTGSGLDPGIEPFKAFQSSKVDGMGMGLSISRSIIESHGGKLWVDKNSKAGARFAFTLPLPAG